MLGNLLKSTESAKDLNAILGLINNTIDESAKVISKSARVFDSSLDDISRATVSVGDNIDDLLDGVKQLGKDFGDVFNVIGNIVGGPVADSFSMLGTVFKNTFEGAANLVKGVNEVTDGLDKGTDVYRDFKAVVAEVGFSFGKTYEESQKFGDSLRDTINRTNLGLFIDPGEIINVAKSFADAGMELDNLNKIIDTSIGSFTILETTIALSNRTGIDQSSIARSITDAVMKQGISVEDATKQFAAYSDISEKTGLTVSDVKNSLETTASGFSELGLSAEFSRPFLENFVTSLEKVGLGIKNATGLSATLSRSVVGLSQDYAKAYLTFERGGIDLGGGGGVLGAAISLEDRLTTARTPEEQQALALDLGKGMAETIASFSGGEIVTAREAVESPELQTQFAIQKQLLTQMYGISGTQATRTLELLDELRTARDPETQRKIGDQLKESVIKQDDTLDESQKTNRNLKQILFQQTLGNDLTLKLLAINREASRNTGAKARENLKDLGAAATKKQRELEMQLDLKDSLNKTKDRISKNMGSGEEGFDRNELNTGATSGPGRATSSTSRRSGLVFSNESGEYETNQDKVNINVRVFVDDERAKATTDFSNNLKSGSTEPKKR